MHPALRVILALIGGAFCAKLAGERDWLLGGFVGTLAGLAIGEVVSLRTALGSLRLELGRLRELMAQRVPRDDAVQPRQGDAIPAAASSAAASPAPKSAPSSPFPAATPGPARASAQAPARASATTAATLSPSDWNALGTERPQWQPPPVNPVFAFLRDYFTGGNTLVRVGVIVLFIGVAFLLRYLAEHTHVPIELRLSGVAVGAFVLLVLGWRLRLRRAGYALGLQGGAVGILYLTVFSALHLYSLMSATMAFALLGVICALSATLAVLQNSLAVALLSATGGFLAPFLASTGHGDHVALFSYFAVLNLAILGMAWFKSWRPLNVAGFAFTFVLSTVWGVLQYRPEDFPSSEPFLILFFLLYVAIAVLYSTRQAPTLHGYIDGTIIFGTPIAAFGLQAAMLHDRPLALAYSALSVSAVYTVLAWLLHRRRGENQRLLVEAFAALGVSFLTLTVPLALNGRWSAASWALEGTALIWVGCRQNRKLARGFGGLLLIAAGGALALHMADPGPVPAGTYLAALMVGVAAACASQILHATRAQLKEYEIPYPVVLFLWGLLWWCLGGISELQQHIDQAYWPAARLLFATATALLCSLLARRSQMRVSLLPTFALLPAMILFALYAATVLDHPLGQAGWIAWPVAFAGFYLILRQHDRALGIPTMNTLHATTFLLLTALIGWELNWQISQLIETGAWAVIAWGIVPAAVLAALPVAVGRIAWPFQAHRSAYSLIATVGLSGWLALWSILTNATVSSPSTPLPYAPLANPLDLTQALLLLLLIRAWLRLRSDRSCIPETFDERPVVVGLVFIGFVWLNAILLRTLHLWAAIPYELEAMIDSTLVQSAVSLLWASIALITMLIATRIGARVVWLTGAGLLAVVVLKLFVVDLSSIGTVARIVSFLGVGVLMLVLGYFSPLPPAAEEST